jgi:two-component system cell cycle sensor histidine kinase/response regulator CckA
LDIRDEGIGIPKANLDRIFDPFFTTKETGLGLGLSTVQSIIRNHGGTILVDSKEGEGTTISVILPVEEYEARESPPPIRRMEEHYSGRILVMDDEEPILDMMAPMLESLTFEPTCVRNGEEAIYAYRLGIASEEPFSAVIMDLTIRGGMGGKEAAHRILAEDPEARVIVFSGYSNDPIMAHPQEYGFRDVLQKLFTLQDLSAKLFDLLMR